MKNLILGIILASFAVNCSEPNQTQSDLFFDRSVNGSSEVFQKTETGEKKLLSTDALDIHYEVHPVLKDGKPALFFIEMWEFGNILSIYNIEQDLWILRNYEHVNTNVEFSKFEESEFVIYLNDEGIWDEVPHFILPVPMRIIDDKSVKDLIECDSEILTTNVNRSRAFLENKQNRLRSETKSIIKNHLKTLEKNCE